jgi:hypothetical protein
MRAGQADSSAGAQAQEQMDDGGIPRAPLR